MQFAQNATLGNRTHFKLNRRIWNTSIRLLSYVPIYLFILICLTIVELVKQAWLLPLTVTLALQQRRRQLTRHQFEAERLDRIRHPSK